MNPPIRVLLVDDQSLFRAAIRVMIAVHPDMEVVGEAGTGVEAVAAADTVHPDVVLMDIRMPDMYGVEATRRLLDPTRPREHPLKVLVLTTFNLDDRAATAIRHGASGFLLKDITPEMLADAIRTVHAGNAVLAPQDLAAHLPRRSRAAAGIRRAVRARARGVRPRRARSVQRRDRLRSLHVGVDGEVPRRRDPPQARPARPRPGRRRRLRARPRGA